MLVIDRGLEKDAGGCRAVLTTELAAGWLITPRDKDIADKCDVFVQVPLQRRTNNTGVVSRIDQYEETAIDGVAEKITQLGSDGLAPQNLRVAPHETSLEITVLQPDYDIFCIFDAEVRVVVLA